MHETRSNRFLIIAIIIAALIIGVAVVYSGRHVGKVMSRNAVDEARLAKVISEQVLARLEQSPLIADQMRTAIENFQQKRVQDQAQQRVERDRIAAQKAKQVRVPSPERDHIRGNPQAIISLIEYSDFECPFCKRFHDTPKRLLALFGKDLNWVYRHFPLSFHNPGAQKPAEASECAGELGGSEAFWRFTDEIYKRTKTGGRGFPIAGLAPLAGELGLDVKAFEACLKSGKHVSTVQENLTEGARVGINGTPGSILRNNKTGEVVLISGARAITDFELAIKTLLGEKPSATVDTKPGS